MNVNDPIQSCLQTQDTYKRVKDIKVSIYQDDQTIFPKVSNAINEVLVDPQASIMSKLLALRLAKDSMDQHNSRFADHFANSKALIVMASMARFRKESSSEERGKYFFSNNPDKNQITIGNSVLRLTLECIKVWAKWYPLNLSNTTSKFYQTYAALITEKVAFPKFQYFKEADIIKYTDNINFVEPLIDLSIVQSDYTYQMPAKQPEKQPEKHQIDTPTPGGQDQPQSVILKQAEQLITATHQAKLALAQACSNSPNAGNYPIDLLNPIIETLKNLTSALDETMEKVLELDKVDLAEQLINLTEELSKIDSDYKVLPWLEFRKFYLQNLPDEFGKQEEQNRKEQFEKQQNEEKLQKEKSLNEKQQEEERQRNLSEQRKQEQIRIQREKEQREQVEKEQKAREDRLLKEQEQRENEKKLREKEEKERKEQEQREVERVQKQKEYEQKEREQQEGDKIKREALQREKEQKALEEQTQQQNIRAQKIAEEKRLQEYQNQKQQEEHQREQLQLQDIHKKQEEQSEIQNTRRQEQKSRLQQFQKPDVVACDNEALLRLQVQQLKDEKNLILREVSEYKEKFENRQEAFRNEQKKRQEVTQELNKLLSKYLEVCSERDSVEVMEELGEQKQLVSYLQAELKEQIQKNCDLEKEVIGLEIRNDSVKQKCSDLLYSMKTEKLHLDLRINDLKDTIEKKDKQISELIFEKIHLEKAKSNYQSIISNNKDEMQRMLSRFSGIIKKPPITNELIVKQSDEIIKSNKELQLKIKAKTESFENELIEISRQYNFEIFNLTTQLSQLEQVLQEANLEIEQKNNDLLAANFQIKNLTTLANMTISKSQAFNEDNVNPEFQKTQNSLSSHKSEQAIKQKSEGFKTSNTMISPLKIEKLSQKVLQNGMVWPESFPSNIILPNQEEIKYKKKPIQIVIESEKKILFSPYTNAMDFYANKKQNQPKGSLRPYQDAFMQLPNESRLFFKMRCLDSKVGLIYLKENYLKVGIVNDIVRNGQQEQLRFGLYIQNLNQKPINGISVSYDFKQLTSIECRPEQIKSFILKPQQIVKQELVVQQNDVAPFVATISFNEKSQQILIPHVITKYITFNTISSKNFKQKWSSLVPNIMRTEIFAFNQQIIQSAIDIQSYFLMSFLNESKINDYWLGKDECKLVSQCKCQDMEFLLKIEVKPDKKMLIQIGFGQLSINQKKTLQKILNIFQFLFMSE